MSSSPFRAALAMVVLSGAALAGVGARPARPTLAVLAVRLDLSVANAVLSGDSALGPAATARLRSELAKLDAYDLVDPGRVDSAAAPDGVKGSPCVSDACALQMARALGADRVLLTKLTKISTPVWYVDTRLLDAGDGRVLRADEFELKGIPQQIVPEGMRVVARRVADAERAAP